MLVYKLTDANAETFNGTQWGPGVTHETNGEGELCGPGWLHCYSGAELATFLDPIHANFGATARLWEATAEGRFKDDSGLKLGCTRLTTIKEIPLIVVTTEQRVEFAIRCAQQVYTYADWILWAENWLCGKDRSQAAAWGAERAAAEAAARAAMWAAMWAAPLDFARIARQVVLGETVSAK